MATTTNYSWTTPDDTDLVKDGASAIRSLGTAIDSTVFTNAGNAVQKSTIDAKGDLLVGTADNTVGRLAVGTNNYVLTADSNETSGIKWAAPAAAGYVGCALQKTATQSIANNTATFLTWNDELIDTNSFHDNSTNTERITIPVGYAGKYLVSALINYDIDAAGIRQLMGRLNGTTFFALVEQPPTNGAYTSLEFNVIRSFAEGDYIELRAYQDSGNSINILSGKDSQFSMTYLGA